MISRARRRRLAPPRFDMLRDLYDPRSAPNRINHVEREIDALKRRGA